MAWVFVRLKLRLLTNRLRHAEWYVALGFVLLALLSGGAAAGAVVGIWAALRFFPQHQQEITVAVYATIALMWVIGPVVAATVDDSLDPRTFEALPLGRGRLGVGLLAAGIVGPGGVATGIGLVGGSLLGLVRSFLALFPVMASAVLGTLLAVAIGRCVTTWLSDVMRSRRSREIVAAAFGLAVGVPAIVGNLIGLGRVDSERWLEVIDALRFTPPGAVGWSAAAFAGGRWVEGLLGFGIGAVSLLVVLWLYGVALARLQVRPGSGPGSVRVVGRGRRLPIIVSGPLGAIAAKELRYARRDPRLRSQFLGAAIGIGAVAVVFGRPLFDSPYAPFAGVFVAAMVMLPVVTNLFGIDSGSFWTYLVAAPDMESVIRGKNLGWGLVILPLGTATAALAGIAAGSLSYLGVAVMAVIAVGILWMSVGNLVSVMGAFPLPEANMFGNSGVGGAALLWSLTGLIGLSIVQAPVALAIGITAWLAGTGWAAVAATASLVYAVSVYLIGRRILLKLLESRTLHILDAVDA